LWYSYYTEENIISICEFSVSFFIKLPLIENVNLKSSMFFQCTCAFQDPISLMTMNFDISFITFQGFFLLVFRPSGLMSINHKLLKVRADINLFETLSFCCPHWVYDRVLFWTAYLNACILDKRDGCFYGTSVDSKRKPIQKSHVFKLE